jgi:hypothetical protein
MQSLAHDLAGLVLRFALMRIDGDDGYVATGKIDFTQRQSRTETQQGCPVCSVEIQLQQNA